LADNPLVACELLAQLADSEQDPRMAVAWLEPVLGEFLYPFFIVLGHATDAVVYQSAIGELARYDIDCLRILLQTASFAGHLNLVLPGFASWLANGALRQALDNATSQYWRDLVWILRPGDVSSQAWLDLALLASGNYPRFLLADLDQQAQLHYNESIASAWTELTTDLGPACDSLLQDALISYLSRQSWPTNSAQAAAVIDLTARLTEAGERARLKVMIEDQLSAVPSGTLWQVVREWLKRLRRRPDISQYES
jgi:hypothetical protein